jgi:sugar phosphate isomerase/epimerase
MTIETEIRRPLGTMIAYGFPRGDVAIDLSIAQQLGATVLEILPDWANNPDPRVIQARARDLGLAIHSAHGCWGGRSIQAQRVDLASLDPATWQDSVDDLKRCVDWISLAGGSCLVVHPGGLSEPAELMARRAALVRVLDALADHANPARITLCVENMPPGVFPGSQMAEIAGIVAELDRPEVGLALDTGHAQISETPESATLAAGRWLRTTHVHDNDGRHDTHLPPGSGIVDWGVWLSALDAIDYRGPILLECIRHLREVPASLNDDLLALLGWLTRLER